LTSIIEKRLSLHKVLESQQHQIEELQSEIIGLEALANIGTATCMIAHEINNLLTPVSSYASLALSNPDDKALAEKVFKKTVTNCKRASQVMQSMLALANGETQDRLNVSLRELVDGIFDCLCRDFAKDGITVNIDIPQELKLWAVPVQIQQVLMNLIINARDAMLANGGVLTIMAESQNNSTTMRISDTGYGIKSQNLERIFEPFFTTKKDRANSSYQSSCGLGLAFCRRVIDEHNGSICVESQPDIGTTFTIILPKPHQDNS
jgi:signal transduction histidine kinase